MNVIENELKRLNRSLDRNLVKLKDLQDRIDTLSKHGYQSIGYLKGKIAEQEDFIDILKEIYESFTFENK